MLLCKTRWKCKINCISAIKNEISQIIGALIELTELNTSEHLIISEAN